MKRILVTVLMVLYMAGAMGATVHLHYCMDRFAGISLIHHEEHKCGMCGMVKKSADNGCCKDVHKTFKTAEHYKDTPTFNFQPNLVALVTNTFLYPGQIQSYIGCEEPTYTVAHSPPNKEDKLPIYLRIRNLRI